MILSPEQCLEMISWNKIYNSSNVRTSPVCGCGQGMHKSKLDYNIAEVPRNEQTQWFFDFIHQFLLEDYPNNTLNEGKFFYSHEFFEGGKFTKHRDKDRNITWKLIVGATLNSEFEGGKLLTYNPDGELASRQGELYKMDSEILHEVTEVTKGTRYSFVYFISPIELGLEFVLI